MTAQQVLRTAAVALVLVSSALASDAILLRRATLREDPSSKHRPLLTLVPPDDLEVLESAMTNGYYHVRASDGTEGWIYGRSIKIVPSPPAQPLAEAPVTASSSGAPPTVGGVSSTIASNWDKPDPNQTQFQGEGGVCGPSGDGGDTYTNTRKNRTDASAAYHEVTWKSLQSLPYPVAARSLADWTAAQLGQIKPYEGIAVSVVGYIDAIKVEDKGSGESTNCHFTAADEVDWHIPLVEHAGDAEATSIVVETTPRIRQSHPKWTTANLAAWVKADAPVRISGWALLDPEHRAHLGKYRATLWEIHPITKIEVFQDGQWINLDNMP